MRGKGGVWAGACISHVLHVFSEISLTKRPLRDGAMLPQERLPIANRSFIFRRSWLIKVSPVLSTISFAWSGHVLLPSTDIAFVSQPHDSKCLPFTTANYGTRSLRFYENVPFSHVQGIHSHYKYVNAVFERVFAHANLGGGRGLPNRAGHGLVVVPKSISLSAPTGLRRKRSKGIYDRLTKNTQK